MDPDLQAARNRCVVTGVRLPNYFLINFGLAPHPKTGKPWQMPKLAIDSNVINSSKTTRSKHAPEQAIDTSNEGHVDTEASVLSNRGPVRAVAGSYIVSQAVAIRFMSEIKRKSYRQIPHRWRLDTRFKADDIVWREDMDTFMLDLMRKKAVGLLKHLSSRPAAYVVKCEGYEDIEHKNQSGAALWLGKPREEELPIDSKAPPPPYAMVKYRSARHIPVYNLPALLGLGYLRQLRDSSQLFDGTLAVVKQKRNTVETLMHLWKLMGYVTSDGDAGTQCLTMLGPEKQSSTDQRLTEVAA
ncbi:MAG: hypothetical protein Q9225_002159 [Loekoesia sp. 1 TL-2023]